MFERFTREARRIVEAAQQEARSVGAGHVRPEHLLVALADRCSPLLFVTERFSPPPLGDPYPLLGLLRHGEAVCMLIARCGVDPARLYERQRASLQQLARLAAS